MKRLLFVLTVMAYMGMASAWGVMYANGTAPHKYGDVAIRQVSPGPGGSAPVVFSHWIHRGRYTCRLCHTDLGFEMRGGSTAIRGAEIRRGKYCGACHNGVMKYEGKPIFAACTDDPAEKYVVRCGRCHGAKDADRKAAFDLFARKMPKERHGNGIDWGKAEEKGLINPVDSLESIPVKRTDMKVEKDFALDAKLEGIAEIIFSHGKHTVWNGCEICHPDIFVGVKKGTTKYSMIEISGGMYCGACHGKVAFPATDCQKCHLKPVQF